MKIRAVILVGALTIAGTASACAPLPAERSPRSIDRTKVPNLFPKASTTLPVTGNYGNVCFVLQGPDASTSTVRCPRLALEARTARTLIEALAAGPNADQREAGLVSLVPQDTKLLGSEMPSDTPGVLMINLSSAMNTLSSPLNIVAYRQIVMTLTDSYNTLDATAIRVEIDGKPTKIPTDDGQLSQASTKNFHDAAIEAPTTTPKRTSTTDPKTTTTG